MNGNNSKSPTTPLLPLRGTSPKGAAGACTNSPWYTLTGILRTAVDPSGAMRRPQLCIKQLYAVEDGYTC